MRAHRNALVAIRKFWQLLLHNQVAFTTLAKALMRIEKSVRVVRLYVCTVPNSRGRAGGSVSLCGHVVAAGERGEQLDGHQFQMKGLRPDARRIAQAVWLRDGELSLNLQAEGIYKNTLQRYPASPKLLRGYGKFLEAVKNNPWKASKYFRCAALQVTETHVPVGLCASPDL